MLVVILGAGASFDSAASFRPGLGLQPEVERWRPPLANDLFGSRAVFGKHLVAYPQLAAGLGQRLRFPLGDDLESVLDTVTREAKANRDRWGQLAAIRFYLRRILWECSDEWWKAHRMVTNYGTLVDTIHHWQREEPDNKACLVTFNYDLLVEKACEAVLGRTFTTLASYVSPDFSIIKPHGSVNWAQYVSGARPAQSTEAQLIQSFENLDLDSHITIVADRLAANTPYDQTGMLVPALTIPLKSKSEFTCPPAQLTAMRNAIQSATKLLVIGWKGPDERFKELWRQARASYARAATLCVVDSSEEEAASVASRIGSVLPGLAENATCVGGFSNFTTSGALEMFLSRAA